MAQSAGLDMHSTRAEINQTSLEPGEHSNGGEVAFLNILDPSFRIDSSEIRVAQESGWYARTPLGPAVLRHAEAALLLNDRRLRPASRETLIAQTVTDGPAARWWLDTCSTPWRLLTTPGCASW
jgi:hypothetical protein